MNARLHAQSKFLATPKKKKRNKLNAISETFAVMDLSMQIYAMPRIYISIYLSLFLKNFDIPYYA